MRISDIAQAAGTTPRTIRHYHRLGLLDEPRRLANGYREYDLADLVRLMRVRWLAGAGVPLGSVSSIVSATTDSAAADDLEADLTALVDTLDAEQRVLAAKRARLQQMLDDHRAGRPVSPLPSGLALVFTELITAEADPAVRAEFERERDAWELVAISGSAPEEFFASATRLFSDPQSRERIVALYRRFAAIRGHSPKECADEIESLSEAMQDAVLVLLVDSGVLEHWQSEIRPGSKPAMPITDVIPDPAQGAILTRVMQRLGILDDLGNFEGQVPS
ncbi:MerR family transcriptional regulator [Prescottella agglutinans]|uniref:DNA-binding transcriptional MerR regulator n=1 Tax=Prescottella agglutinans TaxID=1644129 RepID=A0ABT6MIT8_9NOCA|nr:MerR family transcriptional regulator [Prescottella agglutinans]MDH6283820.1 DNA-binding transcriptional MerR regulator [Prescottella agglutinans]